MLTEYGEKNAEISGSLKYNSRGRHDYPAVGVPVYVISCKENIGIDEMKKYFSSGITISLLGSSGVGKSTLINRIIGKTKQKTNNSR